MMSINEWSTGADNERTETDPRRALGDVAAVLTVAAAAWTSWYLTQR